MKLSWHGQSCVIIETTQNKRVIIDPFITGNRLSDLNSETLNVDAILLTHAHTDHFGDAIPISQRLNIPIVCAVELADILAEEGINAIGMNLGGSHTFDFGTVKFVQADHSNSYKGRYAGSASGIIFSDDFYSVYHAGDTALFSDMALFGPVDVTFLPIGDFYTMGIQDALKATEIIDSNVFIPVHYAPNSPVDSNPYDFINELGDRGIVLEVGDIYEI